MKPSSCLLSGMTACIFGALLAGAPAILPAQEPAVDAEPSVVELGNGRYRIGRIVLDQKGARFTIPGKVLRTEPPLEYFAVKPGGAKAYESLLELDASATEFNLACILIGLSADGVKLPRYQFDPEDVVGPAVDISATWEIDGETREASAAEMIYVSGKPVAPDRWRYIGSYRGSGADSPYMAEVSGNLVSFVHDPHSVIDHEFGIGIGAYGSIGGNTALLPTLGQELEITVQRVTGQH